MSYRSRISFLVGSLLLLSLLAAGIFIPTADSVQAAFPSSTPTSNNVSIAAQAVSRSFLPIVYNSSNSSINKRKPTPTPTATITQSAPTATPAQPTAIPPQPTATQPKPTATIIPSPTLTTVPIPGARIYYISTTGSDNNPGTEASPWRTIQKAANSMAAGDTVYVSAGDYSTQRVTVTRSGAAGSPITYQAQGRVVMKGFNIAASYVTVNGFEIANTDYVSGWSRTSQGIVIEGAYNIIENNYIHDAAMIGILFLVSDGNAAAIHDNIVRNNRLYHNQQVGIEVHGRNNLIEGNEIWGTVQCLPSLTKVEDAASANNGASCPNYPTLTWLDADGIDFFGQGHIFRHNYIHDIPFGPTGLNPSIGDYNDNPHIDCFQTWSDSSSHETAANILFEGNRCDNAQVNGTGPETGSGFMLAGGANHLTIRNNILKVYMGIYAGGLGEADHLYIYNNIWQNDLSIKVMWPKVAQLEDTPYTIIKNNIFYDQPYMTVYVSGDTTGTEIAYNLAYNSDGSIPRCVQWGSFNTCQSNPNHEMWGVDPQFVDPAARDYHLKSTSPAINAGSVLSDVNIDYDGISRPQGGSYDIGPFER
jgi:hypothetical protein